MSKYAFTPSQLQAVASMKALGFTHGKIELEAELGRESGDYRTCDSCNYGYNDCEDCFGSGVSETTSESPGGRTLAINEVCTNCDGEGQFECGDCHGDYESVSSDYSDDDDCARFLTNYVSAEARAATVFSLFYDDGSVDSEFTFTMKLEDLPLAVEYLDAFKALGDEVGGGLDTRGAGMHLTAMTSGVYPVYDQQLDPDKLSNFTTEVTKLLPALYFVASPDHQARGLSYRPPRISEDKYSAICTHDGTALEYRIFETCYQRPAALLEDFEVIANTLKYYSNRKVKLSVPTYKIQDAGEGVERFYDTSEKLKSLNDGLPYIKPKNKTITELKRERNFKLSLSKLNLAERVAQRRYRVDYDAYVARETARHEERLQRAIRDRDSTRITFGPGNRNNFTDRDIASSYRFLLTDEANDLDQLRNWATDNGYLPPILSFSDWLSREVNNSNRGFMYVSGYAS